MADSAQSLSVTALLAELFPDDSRGGPTNPQTQATEVASMVTDDGCSKLKADNDQTDLLVSKCVPEFYSAVDPHLGFDNEGARCLENTSEGFCSGVGCHGSNWKLNIFDKGSSAAATAPAWDLDGWPSFPADERALEDIFPAVGLDLKFAEEALEGSQTSEVAAAQSEEWFDVDMVLQSMSSDGNERLAAQLQQASHPGHILKSPRGQVDAELRELDKLLAECDVL